MGACFISVSNTYLDINTFYDFWRVENGLFNLEVPAGFEPAVSELQSLALPLGYGTKLRGNYSKSAG
jgi:hypothetical protein